MTKAHKITITLATITMKTDHIKIKLSKYYITKTTSKNSTRDLNLELSILILFLKNTLHSILLLTARFL